MRSHPNQIETHTSYTPHTCTTIPFKAKRTRFSPFLSTSLHIIISPSISYKPYPTQLKAHPDKSQIEPRAGKVDIPATAFVTLSILFLSIFTFITTIN